MDWENLRIFALLARQGTLSAAGRAAGVEHATVARRVAALEAELGLKLVDRRGRHLSLTAEGQRIAALAERMEEGAIAIERAAVGDRSEIAGEVVISAPPAYADRVLAEPFLRLRREHPQLSLTILGDKREASLARREADIAIRMTRPVEGELTIMRIGEVSFSFYAARGYVGQVPEAEWSFISYDREMENAPQHRKLLEFAAGRSIGFRASTLDLQVRAVCGGAGIAILPDFMIEPGMPVEVVPTSLSPLNREVWLVVHPDIRHAPAIRAVIDAVSAG
ncbi:LysR family transcriptional regulator [Rhizobium sp. PAMB 3182]